MKDWKKICMKLLFPQLWLMFLLTVLSTTGLIVVFMKGWETSVAACILYCVAFYTLSVICLACWKTFPGYYRNIRKKVYTNKYGNRYMTDAAFRTHVSLYASLIVNLLYVGVNVLSFFLYDTMWFMILAVYYIILAVMRFLLLRYVGKNEVGTKWIAELKRSRVCAMILLTVNFVLSGAVLMILYQNKGFVYNGILIYVMATYTFYVTTLAIINIVKYRKYNSPVLSTAKVISLSAALVSMLSLETAMLSQFGGETTPLFKWIMIAATGFGVSVIVILMSVYMIAKATKEIRRINNSET